VYRLRFNMGWAFESASLFELIQTLRERVQDGDLVEIYQRVGVRNLNSSATKWRLLDTTVWKAYRENV